VLFLDNLKTKAFRSRLYLMQAIGM